MTVLAALLFRQPAAWAATLAVATAIAGIHAMNVEHVPELKTAYGYVFAPAVIAAICSLRYPHSRRAL